MKYAPPEEFESFIRLKLEELQWFHKVDLGLSGDTLVLKTHKYVMDPGTFAALVDWLADTFGCYLTCETEQGHVFRFEDR